MCFTKVDYYALRKLVTFDEFVIFVHVPNSLVFHFFRDVVKEAAPSWSMTKLRDVIAGHLNALVCDHEKACAREVVNVVDVVGWGYGGEISFGLKNTKKENNEDGWLTYVVPVPDLDDLPVSADHHTVPCHL